VEIEEMTEYGEYGETLARYRIEAGLNQRELGKAISLDSTQLNKVERGHRPPLGAKYMKPLVRALRLRRSQAENLADLADLSRKILDFMDEGEDGESQVEGEQQPQWQGPSVQVPA
jgi:transcriptional regulator with XRE-family HTH domain